MQGCKDKDFERFLAVSALLSSGFRDLTFRLRGPRGILNLGVDAALTVACLTTPGMNRWVSSCWSVVHVAMQCRSLEYPDHEAAGAGSDMLTSY
jgi:hypothetical protein